MQGEFSDEEKRAYFAMMYSLMDGPVFTREENELVHKMFNIPIGISNIDTDRVNNIV